VYQIARACQAGREHEGTIGSPREADIESGKVDGDRRGVEVAELHDAESVVFGFLQQVGASAELDDIVTDFVLLLLSPAAVLLPPRY